MGENDEKVIIPGHALEFQKDDTERFIEVFTNEPTYGVNENTGLFLILHVMGGHAEKRYFFKLRREWSDYFNVITVSVNYLGTKNEYIPYEIIYDHKTIQKLYDKLPEDVKKVPPPSFFSNFEELVDFFPNQDLRYQIVFDTKPLVTKNELRDYRDYGYIQTIDCLYAVRYAPLKYERAV